MGLNNSKSLMSVKQCGTAVEGKDDNNAMVNSEGCKRTSDGLDMRCVSLASHQMVPSKFEETVHLLESVKQAKQLFKKYTTEPEAHYKRRPVYYQAEAATGEATKAIAEGREKQNKGVPARLVAAVGSEEEIYSVGADCGLFAAVLTAYSHHYKLRTSPDDWWFCVIRRVASVICENSENESVRKMFVNHEGKKTITVPVDDPNFDIYTVNYNWFFDQITKGIQENVKVPEFVDGMTADFGTTTPVQKIVSQITLMNSMKRYFEYLMLGGCGIPAVEMLGTEEDWRRLTTKLKVLRTLLEPIENNLGLEPKWWKLVQKVFTKLLETYQGRPDEEWWSHIMDYEQAYASGMPITGESNIRGWITDFLEETFVGSSSLRKPGDFSSGLVTVPLTIVDLISKERDTAALVAGMLGFTVHRTDTSDEVTVQPFQGWALMLADDSPLL